MPVRVALNLVYALLVKHLDAEERRKFDDELYGFTELNQRAERALWGIDGSGDGLPEAAPVPAVGVPGVDD